MYKTRKGTADMENKNGRHEVMTYENGGKEVSCRRKTVENK